LTFHHPNILRKKQLRAKLPLVLRRFSSHTLHQSLQTSVDLLKAEPAQPMLTVTLGWGAPGGDIFGPTSSFSSPPQPKSRSRFPCIARPMLRDLLILAVILALIIAGILIQLWR
jgi:hypothetical protein